MVTGVTRPKAGNSVYKPIQVFRKQEQDVSSGTLKMAGAVDTLATAFLDVAHKEGQKNAKISGQNSFLSLTNESFVIDAQEFLDEEKTQPNPNFGKPVALGKYDSNSGGQIARDAYERLVVEKYFRRTEDEINAKNVEFYNKVGKNGYTISQYKTDISNFADSMVKFALPQFKVPITNMSGELVAKNVIKLQQEQLARNTQKAIKGRAETIQKEIEILDSLIDKYGINSEQVSNHRKVIADLREEEGAYSNYEKNNPNVKQKIDQEIANIESTAHIRFLKEKILKDSKNSDNQNQIMDAFIGVLNQISISNNPDKTAIKQFNALTDDKYALDIISIMAQGKPNARSGTASAMSTLINNEKTRQSNAEAVALQKFNQSTRVETLNENLNSSKTSLIYALQNGNLDGALTYAQNYISHIDTAIAEFGNIKALGKTNLIPTLKKQKQELAALVSDSFSEAFYQTLENSVKKIAGEEGNNVNTVVSHVQLALSDLQDADNNSKVNKVIEQITDEKGKYHNSFLKIAQYGSDFPDVESIATHLKTIKSGDYFGDTDEATDLLYGGSYKRQKIIANDNLSNFINKSGNLFNGIIDNIARTTSAKNAAEGVANLNLVKDSILNLPKIIDGMINTAVQDGNIQSENTLINWITLSNQELEKYKQAGRDIIIESFRGEIDSPEAKLALINFEKETDEAFAKGFIDYITVDADNSFGGISYLNNLREYMNSGSAHDLNKLLYGEKENQPMMASFYESFRATLNTSDDQVLMNRMKSNINGVLTRFTLTKEEQSRAATINLINTNPVEFVKMTNLQMAGGNSLGKGTVQAIEQVIGDINTEEFNIDFVRMLTELNEPYLSATIENGIESLLKGTIYNEQQFQTVFSNVKKIMEFDGGATTRANLEKLGLEKYSSKLHSLYFVDRHLAVNNNGVGVTSANIGKISDAFAKNFSDFVPAKEGETKDEINTRMRDLVRTIFTEKIGGSRNAIDNITNSLSPFVVYLSNVYSNLKNLPDYEEQLKNSTLEKFLTDSLNNMVDMNFAPLHPNEIHPLLMGKLPNGVNAISPSKDNTERFHANVINHINYNTPKENVQIPIGNSNVMQSLGDRIYVLNEQYQKDLANISDATDRMEYQAKHTPVYLMPSGSNNFTAVTVNPNTGEIDELIRPNLDGVPTIFQYNLEQFPDLPEMSKYNELETFFLSNVSREQFRIDAAMRENGIMPSLTFLDNIQPQRMVKGSAVFNTFVKYFTQSPAQLAYLKMLDDYNDNLASSNINDFDLKDYLYHLEGITSKNKGGKISSSIFYEDVGSPQKPVTNPTDDLREVFRKSGIRNNYE
jgi:hypothetical protein